MPTGRPSDYTPDLAERICSAIMTSTKGLRTICEENEGFPHVDTIIRWIHRRPEFYESYARAREIQQELRADEILEISDDGKNDTYLDENGKLCTNHDVINRSRLRVESRKWLMSKLAAKKFGDTQLLKHAGSDGGPMTVNLVLTPQALIPPPIEAKLITADESEDTE